MFISMLGPSAGIVKKARIESDEDSEDAERKRKEKNMKKLMALGDSSSEDERPAEERRPQTVSSGSASISIRFTNIQYELCNVLI